jgi:hypothetical protein
MILPVSFEPDLVDGLKCNEYESHNCPLRKMHDKVPSDPGRLKQAYQPDLPKVLISTHISKS